MPFLVCILFFDRKFSQITAIIVSAENIITVLIPIGGTTYDAEGNEVERYRLQPGTECMVCHVPTNQYHTCVSLESGSVIVEFKNGKYDPVTTEIFLETQ